MCIELRRDANANVILNQLLKHTQLQDTFGVIMLALVDQTAEGAESAAICSNDYLEPSGRCRYQTDQI